MVKYFIGRTRSFLSLVKFSHTIFSLPFAIVGFFLAIEGSTPDWKLLLKVVLCVLFARNAAMSFNRYIDRKIDLRNPRTVMREIPSNIISPSAAFLFVLVNSLLFIVITFFINPLCFMLSPVALAVILGYSYTKRFSAYSHLFLGLGLALAPIGAYLAVTGRFDIVPLLFSVAVLFWVAGFDIIYSLQDEEFDADEKLRSLPVKAGPRQALMVSLGFHIITALAIIIAGYKGPFGIYYWTGALIFILLLFYQHTLVKPGRLEKVNLAFFTTNGVASLVFAAFVILDLYI